MADRINTGPDVPSVGNVPTIDFRTGDAEAMDAVSNLIAGVNNQLNDHLDKVAVVEGKAEGTEAGAEGVPDIDRRDYTIRGQAFNAAALQSYSNKIDLQMRRRIVELEDQHKHDPDGYKKAADAYFSGLKVEVESVDPVLANTAQQEFQLRSMMSFNRVRDRFLKRETDEMKGAVVALKDQLEREAEDIAEVVMTGSAEEAGVAMANFNAARERLRAAAMQRGPDGSLMMSPAEREKAIIKYEQDFALAMSRNWVEQQPDPAAALEAIQKGQVFVQIAEIGDDGQPTGQRKKVDLFEMLDDAGERKLEAFAASAITAENRARSIRLQRTSRQVADLEIAIATGQATMDDIEKADARGLFKDRESARPRLIRSLMARNKKANEDAAEASRVSNAINGNGFLNPKDKSDKDAVDNYWKSTDAIIKKQTAGAKPEETEALRRTAVVRLVQSTGILPKSVQGEIVASIRAGDVEDRVAASELVAQLNEIPGNTLSDSMPKKDLAVALQISRLVSAGRTPDQAVEAALEATSPQNRDVIEARKQEIIDEKFEKNYLSVIEEEYDPWFGFAADVPTEGGVRDRIVGDYRVLFEDWYKQTGDEETAKEQAVKDLRRMWAPTEVDGDKRVMKYAPEAFYGYQGGGDGEWMRLQLRGDVKKIKDDVDPDAIRLGADDKTAREAALGKPTYPVLVRQEDGLLVPLRKDGKNVRWHPDPSKVKNKAEKEALEKAREKRMRRAIQVGTPENRVNFVDRPM